MNSDLADRLDLARQGVLLFVVAVVPAAFWTHSADVFQLPKATLVVVAAAAVVVLSAVRLITTGEVAIPAGPAVYAATGLALVTVVTAVASAQLHTGLLGTYGRWNGAFLYLACIILFLGTIRAFNSAEIERLVLAVVGGVGLVVAYGFLQYVDADPIDWQGALSDGVFASLGNPNFAGATMAIGAPLAARWLVSATLPLWTRIASGALAVACVGVAVATDTMQGPVAAVAGLSVVAAAVLLERGPVVRRIGLAVLAVGASVSALVVMLGVRGVGPMGSIGDQIGVTLRGYYWEAAVSMWADNPLLGVGLGAYGAYHRAHRPLEAAVGLPAASSADAAHSVPLSMFAEGGIVLGVVYLAFVVAVGIVAVRGLLRTEGQQRLLLGSVAGGWTAYQVQSLVSIDVPALAMLHWVLAGAIVVLAGPPQMVTRRMSWASPPPRPGRRTKGRQQRPTKRPIEALAPVFGAAVFVLLLFPLTRPFRADAAAFRAESSATAATALERSERAVTLAPWEPTYRFGKSQIEVQAGQREQAQETLADAVERDPSSLTNVMTLARVAESRDGIDVARRAYRQALDLEAQSPEIKAEVAAFELDHGDPSRAVELLETATELRDDEGEWWQLLGEARLATDDEPGARDAFERALAIDPDDKDARDGLVGVGAP